MNELLSQMEKLITLVINFDRNRIGYIAVIQVGTSRAILWEGSCPNLFCLPQRKAVTWKCVCVEAMSNCSSSPPAAGGYAVVQVAISKLTHDLSACKDQGRSVMIFHCPNRERWGARVCLRCLWLRWWSENHLPYEMWFGWKLWIIYTYMKVDRYE